MASKRARKPLTITPEPPAPEELFVGISGNPLERPLIPEVVAVEEIYGDEEAAITDLLGLSRAGPGTEIVANSTIPDSYQTMDHAGSVDAYIRAKVLTEMYGTDHPSDYDKLSLAIRNRL